jgi:hypothetical protein
MSRQRRTSSSMNATRPDVELDIFADNCFASFAHQSGNEEPGRDLTFGYTERQSMQSQIDSVRSVLNQLVEPGASSSAAAMQTPPRGGGAASSRPAGAAAAGGGLEGLLEHISSRLANIEGLYADMSSRLVRRFPIQRTKGRHAAAHALCHLHPRYNPKYTACTNMCGRCEGGVEEVWGRCGGGVEEVWRRCGGGVEEVWGSA